MKGNLHRSIAGAACGSAALVIALTVGCAASRAPAVAVRPDASRTAPTASAPAPRPGSSSDREAIDQKQAQHVWCEYLEALYLRANAGALGWPRLEECVAVRSTASPEVLTQTANCALHALHAFAGDPFSAAYAGEVSRCGVAALNAAASVELEPFIRALCGRAVACGEASDVECRESFSPALVMNLERAIGAMNRGGREQLRACLRASSCEALEGRISTCLDPILDQLLWLPD